jgi:hypothetical protein
MKQLRISIAIRSSRDPSSFDPTQAVSQGGADVAEADRLLRDDAELPGFMVVARSPEFAIIAYEGEAGEAVLGWHPARGLDVTKTGQLSVAAPKG